MAYACFGCGDFKMNLFKALILVFGLFFLASTAPALAEMSVEKVVKKTKVKINKSNGLIEFIGPKINSLKNDPYYARSFMDQKYGLVVHFIIVEYDFIKAKGSGDSSIVRNAESAYKNFYTAVDSAGNEFELGVFKKRFDGCGSNSFCSFDEYFRISLTDEYFRENNARGIALRARSRAGVYMDIFLYPAYVQGFLLRIQQERENRGIN